MSSHSPLAWSGAFADTSVAPHTFAAPPQGNVPGLSVHVGALMMYRSPPVPGAAPPVGERRPAVGGGRAVRRRRTFSGPPNAGLPLTVALSGSAPPRPAPI